MDPPIQVVNGALFCMKDNHNQPIQMVIMDEDVQFNDKLLCLACFQKKQTLSKNIISIDQVKKMIAQRPGNLKVDLQQNISQTLNIIIEFQQKMKDLQSQVLHFHNEISRITQHWITDISNLDLSNPTQESKQLSSDISAQQKSIKKSTQSHLLQILHLFKKLLIFKDYQISYDLLNKVNRITNQQLKNADIQQQPFINQLRSLFNSQKNQQERENMPQKDAQLCPIKYQQVNRIQEKDWCGTMAFNNEGSLLVSGCTDDIKVWKFDKGKMIELKKLKGHKFRVFCIVFSKFSNWFASGSEDSTIRCWKEHRNNDWISNQPQCQHTGEVYQIIINNNEDQLISCSGDFTIKVWKLSCNMNQLQFDYSLNKHQSYVQAISLNESETSLVSCCYNKQIILWAKGKNQQWEYLNHIETNDQGYKICFINNNQFAWQQWNYNFTQIFQISNGELKELPELKIKLKDSNGNSDLFPTIFNKAKQVLIQRHNNYIYIIRKQKDGKYKVESEPIDCKVVFNYGSLTNDGQYLVSWTAIVEEFKVYKINYA